jgi:hypothetical protein
LFLACPDFVAEIVGLDLGIHVDLGLVVDIVWVQFGLVDRVSG